MFEVIENQLWIGNSRDARNPVQLYQNGIEAVIDLAGEEPIAGLPRDLIYCRFPLTDDGENRREVASAALSTTLNFTLRKIPSLVACSFGMSRSPAVVAFALAIKYSQTPQDALLKLAERKPLDVNPALWNQLMKIYKTEFHKADMQ